MSRNTSEFERIFNLAHKAGMEAVKNLTVVPMVVEQHADILNDNSPVIERWFVEDGACGFAWVNIKPGNSAFAKWMKEKGHARKDDYYGGVTYWIGMFNQSVQKKETYAYAFAAALNQFDIRAYANSRLD